jgi:subfamily B ATP-binding cassette protein MsbA
VSADLRDNGAGRLGAFRWLISRYVRRHAAKIVLVAAVTLGGNLLAVVQPVILAGLLSAIGGGTPTAAPSASWFDLNQLGARVTHLVLGSRSSTSGIVALFGLLFLVHSTVVAAFNYAATQGSAWLRVEYTKLIQRDLLEHLLAQDMAFFTRERSGELVSRVATDSVATATALGPLVQSLIHHNVQILVYSAYLLSTSAWLAIGAAVLLALQFGVTQALRAPIRRLTQGETDSTAAFTGVVQEALTSIRVTKSFGAEAFELAKLDGAMRHLATAVLNRSRVEKLESPLRSVLDALAVLGIFLIAVLQVRNGTLTFQGLLLFTYVGKLLITPINSSATTALYVEMTTAAYSRISELLAQRPSVVDGPVEKRGFDEAIEIRDVSYSYGDRRAIDEVSLRIAKGEFIALVGSSGAGKSTLADLVLRLCDPQSGTVTMDGQDVRRFRQRDYRQLFGVVSQESLLIHDSIENNIRFGKRELRAEDIERAARIANAHEFVAGLPRGYQTVVGDRGTRLSGGERQRIAIARAVVHRPPILVLDEATSSLDSESERLVQDAIDRIVAETTAIVIAHRLSTVVHADRIVVLNRGRIEAIGSHAELLRVSQTYQSFCSLQFGAGTPSDGDARA